MITLDRVTFGYGSHPPVLKELSLSVSQGESVCFMGANGCGKSTLARILAGLTVPQSGSVLIDVHGQLSVPNAYNSSRPVGILFQNPDNQMVAVTVEKEIAFALENAAVPMPDMELAVSATLEQFGIEHLRNRLTTELSGGEKQRVALAAVTVSKPPIIVLDEPDSFLDERGKLLLNKALSQMHASNKDLIELRITQYPDVAESYMRLVVMHNGKIVADGDPQTILGNDDFCESVGLKYANRLVSYSESSTTISRRQVAEISEVRLKGVSFGYSQDHLIVRDLSFEWQRGKTVGLAGASGSGKSTIGLILCGLLKPTTGNIELLDEERLPVVPARISGAVVGSFQQPERQFFLPTCAEEIAFGPKNFGVSLTTARIAYYLATVGLDPEKFASRDPFSLSMGEKRRLAFAAIISMNPAFVVFDEPTCGLDPEGVGRFVRLSVALKKINIGQLIISHDSEMIMNLCDRILCLTNDGHAMELSPDNYLQHRS